MYRLIFFPMWDQPGSFIHCKIPLCRDVFCFLFQGGIKGVVFTDVFQAFIMLVGLLIVIIQVYSMYHIAKLMKL